MSIIPRFKFVYQYLNRSLDTFAEALAPFLPTPPGGSSTLQEVLDNNHDLVDGNNFQGTGAGADNTGTEVIAIGTVAAGGNSGTNVIAIGVNAGNTNTGNDTVFIGTGSGTGASGNGLVGIGSDTLNSNTGSRVVALGQSSGTSNTGTNVIILGYEAGMGNPRSGSVIISNNCLPSYVDNVAADADISTDGIAGNTYLYYNQTTHSIGAVRL